jgi:hypothetical protein
MDENRSPYVVTRFSGEMFASGWLRAKRQCAHYEFDHIVAHHHWKWPRTFLWPIRIFNSLSRPCEDHYFEAVDDATAWPLKSVFSDFDLVNLLCDEVATPISIPTSQTALRFCPECATQQRHTLGTSWWVRDHNLPFVSVCPQHGLVLYWADRRAICSEGGAMPHEIHSKSKKLDVKASAHALHMAVAIVSLCHHAPRILSQALFDFILRGLGCRRHAGKEYDVVAHVHSLKFPKRKVHNNYYYEWHACPGEDELYQDLVVAEPLYPFVGYPLATFAELSANPAKDLEILTEISSQPIFISDDIEERALDAALSSCKWLAKKHKRQPEDLLTEIFERYLKYEPFYSSLARPWLVPLFLLQRLWPERLRTLAINQNWLSVLDRLKGCHRKMVWYAICQMITASNNNCDPTRSLRITLPVNEQPVDPMLNSSVLRLILWNGQYALDDLRR